MFLARPWETWPILARCPYKTGGARRDCGLKREADDEERL